jgi:hypothetical protein
MLMLFGFVGGQLLDRSLSSYTYVFGAGGVAALIGSIAIRRMPSVPVSTLSTGTLWKNLREAAQDSVFRQLLIGWMIMGLGNLMLIPLRIELLANPDYGINATNTQIAILMTFLVPVFRLLSTMVWGHVFDHFNLISVRIALNVVFCASIVLFFFSGNLWVMGVGAALLGIAFGGGSVMWALWVTKVAPAGKVPLYMSVHGFFTGTRAAVAPFIGYTMLILLNPSGIACVSLCLIGGSTLIFYPLRRVLLDLDRAEEARIIAQSLNRR